MNAPTAAFLLKSGARGVVNFLIWYYEHVNRDERIAAAVTKFDCFPLDPARGDVIRVTPAATLPG